MITLDHLTYFYKGMSQPSIDDITTTLPAGIHLLLGQNSAGKTTLLHLIAGLLTPTSGTIDIDGATPARREPSFLSTVFYVGESTTLPTSTIHQFADIHSPFYPNFDREMFERNLALFGQNGNEMFDSLSMGNRKKAILSYAIALQTETLLLDEPANGLDIGSKQILQRMFAECIAEGKTVIISTHSPEEFAYLFDGIIMIHRGRLVFSFPTWQITERITFGSSMLPPESPLYMEQKMGLFRFIAAATDGETSVLDYQLLYNALLSPQSANIINQLNADNEQ